MNTTDHILRNTRAVMQAAFSSGDADGAVTVTATNASGVVVSTGAATSTGGGTYTYALAPQPDVARLDVAWVGAWGGVEQRIDSKAEIVGGYLFNLAEARAFDDGVLADPVKYPDSMIRQARAGIAEFFRDVTGRAFVPMYGRETLDGTDDGRLFLKARGVRRVIGATVGGVALTVDELAAVGVYDSGMLVRTGWRTATPRGVVVEYEYGDEFPPWAVHEAALVYLRYLLVSSDLSDRTITFTNELGTVRNAVASTRYPTGLPTVDAVLGRYGRRRLFA